jgi:hypothetical protein
VFEAEGVDRVRTRRVISRQHPIKTMFVGVITRPNEEHNFSGVVSLKQLSRQHQLLRDTYRYRFHLDYHVNQLIVDGEWRHLHDDPTYTMDELSHLISNYYQLEDVISESLCFRYITHIGPERTRSFIRILGHDAIENKTFVNEHGSEVQLTIDAVEISCYLPAGTIVGKEVNCNSAFMF